MRFAFQSQDQASTCFIAVTERDSEGQRPIQPRNEKDLELSNRPEASSKLHDDLRLVKMQSDYLKRDRYFDREAEMIIT